MRILYVRHGMSMANAAGTVAVPETPLAEEGLEQARITGQDLKEHHVTKVICSPFIRAQQTAEAIASELGIPVRDVVVVDELHERRCGDLEGKPDNYEVEFFYSNDTACGFESQQDLIDRTTLALQKVKQIANTTAGTTVVVGHAVSGFYFLQIAKGKTKFEDFDTVNELNNAEFIEINTA